jgi:hypothetical protein
MKTNASLASVPVSLVSAATATTKPKYTRSYVKSLMNGWRH